MSITALVVCDRPYTRTFEGLDVVVHDAGRIDSAAKAQAAWFDAIDSVSTEHFFFLDSDDDLPLAADRVLDRCLAANVPLAYTDELWISEGGSHRHCGAPYSQDEHLARPLIVHHLALCRTDAARDAVHRLPRGHYWPEMMLFWELAKGGARYVPEIGYHWNKRATGLHQQWFTALGQAQSRFWCLRNP